MLETAAHIDTGGLPLNRFLVAIDVPDPVWNRRLELAIAELPVTWAAIPAGRASVRTGTEWVASLRTAILLVPSAIVPEEPLALINPRHSDASTIEATVIRPFDYDRLFRRRES